MNELFHSLPSCVGMDELCFKACVFHISAWHLSTSIIVDTTLKVLLKSVLVISFVLSVFFFSSPHS